MPVFGDCPFIGRLSPDREFLKINRRKREDNYKPEHDQLKDTKMGTLLACQVIQKLQVAPAK